MELPRQRDEWASENPAENVHRHRPRRSAKARREQARRADFRALCRIVAGMHAVERHRGNALSRIGQQISAALHNFEAKSTRPTTCRHWMLGQCTFGERCRFSHDVAHSGFEDDGNKGQSSGGTHQPHASPPMQHQPEINTQVQGSRTPVGLCATTDYNTQHDTTCRHEEESGDISDDAKWSQQQRDAADHAVDHNDDAVDQDHDNYRDVPLEEQCPTTLTVDGHMPTMEELSTELVFTGREIERLENAITIRRPLEQRAYARKGIPLTTKSKAMIELESEVDQWRRHGQSIRHAIKHVDDNT